MDDLAKKAKEILEKVRFITIATVNADSQPWNTPVSAAYDAAYNFYWVSSKESTHSQNIKLNNRIFIVVYDTGSPEGGVYIQGLAYELEHETEVDYALKHLNARGSKLPKTLNELIGEAPDRAYRAVPEKVWINGLEQADGTRILGRVEIDLLGST